jgi:hypothetical protein
VGGSSRKDGQGGKWNKPEQTSGCGSFALRGHWKGKWPKKTQLRIIDMVPTLCTLEYWHNRSTGKLERKESVPQKGLRRKEGGFFIVPWGKAIANA